ncbi:MAG: Gfo/Idh/MocA family oxidoreductase, partial [Pseudomonadota bacterium]
MKKILRLVIFRLHSTNTVDLRAKIDRPASIYVRFHRAFASMTPEEYDLICVTMNHLRENLRYFSSPLRLGLVGISGYAGYIGRWLVSADGLPPSDLSLTSMYVPDPHLHQERISELSKLGVTFHPSYEALLEDNLDFVWLPVPMHLHRVMTEEALARGVSVMCEKPVAATIEDAMAMHEASRRARVPVLIGFQNMFEPATLELKRALLNARDNDPLHAVVTAGWPRGAKYYKRNDWAGRLRKNGDWVLDGPAGNAMAHFINLAAFLLGQNEMESARPVSIEAELYRANAIESYDTFSARVRFADNSTMTALLTHACETDLEPTVSISGPRINACWRDLTDRVDVRRDGLVSMILR